MFLPNALSSQGQVQFLLKCLELDNEFWIFKNIRSSKQRNWIKIEEFGRK